MNNRYIKTISKYFLFFMLLSTTVACKDDDTDIDNSVLTLLSYTPENGSEISESGIIQLIFSKNVRQAAGSTITMNGQAIRVIITNNVVYCHFDESTAEKLSLEIPEGALTDLNGQAFEGIKLNFTIAPTIRLFDAVVDKNGKGDYTTVQAAIDAAPTGLTKPYLIFVANGTYEELVNVYSTKPFIHLIGQDWEKTIITYLMNRTTDINNAGYYCSSRNPENAITIPQDGATVIQATDFYAENISFENKWGVEHRENRGPQADAVITRADRIAFNHCRMRSYQDTWWTRNYTTGSSSNINMRNYVIDSWIEGAIDYVYGGGNILIENSTFYNVGPQSKITAGSHVEGTEWGYVIKNCTIDGTSEAENSTVLGRPWQNDPITVFIDTKLNIDITPAGWEDMSTYPKLYAEYQTIDKNNNPVDISQRKDEYKVNGVTLPYSGKKELDASDVALYTYENIIVGTDGWNPKLYMQKTNSPVVTKSGTTLSWGKVANAICYLVFKDDIYQAETTETSIIIDDADAVYTVKSVNKYGALSD